MSKYEENSKWLSDLKGVPKNIVEMALAGANRNLKLLEFPKSNLLLTYGTKRNSDGKIM
jgi:hypothetical protein